MKKMLYFSLLMWCGTSLLPAQTLLQEMPEYKIQFGDIHDVDINADGKLDIFIGGNDYSKSPANERLGADGSSYFYQTVLLMWGETQQAFYESSTNFMSNSRPYAVFADLDGDNILDMVYAHHGTIAAFPEDFGLFIGDGNGNFNRTEMSFDDDTYEFFPRACAVADVNLDGKPDIIAIGCGGKFGASDYVDYSAVLMNNGEFVGDMKFNVTNRSLFANNAWSYPQIQVLDINNDGYPDFVLTASDASDNAVSDKTFTDIFVNKGVDAPGEFERLYLCEEMGAAPQYLGPVMVQDFNGDGYLDVFITGKNGSSSVSPMNLYLNKGDGTFQKSTQENFRSDMRNENSTATQAKAFDWDGDGIPDIILSGYVSETPATQTGFWWKNDGSANFGPESRIPGASNSCMAFPDWNGDGVRDIMIIGKTTSTTYITQGGSNYFEAMITKGEAPVNTRPSAPAGLQATVADGTVTLSWEAATDDRTPANSLSYEYYIINSDGEVYNNCRSIIGGDLDGSRMILELGNAFLNRSVTLKNLPEGEYTWGVQAIDASYEGSVFATGSFSVSNSSVRTDAVSDVKVWSDNKFVYAETGENASMKIFDVYGRLLENIVFDHSCTKEIKDSGVYTVIIESEDSKPVVRKVIIR